MINVAISVVTGMSPDADEALTHIGAMRRLLHLLTIEAMGLSRPGCSGYAGAEERYEANGKTPGDPAQAGDQPAVFAVAPAWLLEGEGLPASFTQER